jgi:hypothetical protein
MQINELLVQALEDKTESDKVDFKEMFDVSSKADWCEIIKDIVAMANSGGGILLIGVTNEGKPSGQDVTKLLEYDPADITNKLFSFTGKNFGKFKIVSAQKENRSIAALVIDQSSIPLVFIKTGDYSDKNGKQKQAFANGMVYFRHGAKSEPCTSDDLQQFVNREINILRDGWLTNIRKVVEAPEGAQIIVIEGNQPTTGENEIHNIRLVDDPDAPVYQMLDTNKTHPYRGKEVIELLHKHLGEQVKLSSYDILAVRYVHKIENVRRYFYLPHHGAPSYSNSFVEWLIEQFEKNHDFFQLARDEYRIVVLEKNAKRKQMNSGS